MDRLDAAMHKLSRTPRPYSKPLQIVRGLHAARDVRGILKEARTQWRRLLPLPLRPLRKHLQLINRLARRNVQRLLIRP